MKKSILLLLVCSLVATVGVVSSCDNDDGYSLGNFYITMVTVERSGNSLYFVQDNGDKLWPAATQVSMGGLRQGDRLWAEFTLLSDRQGDFAHYVRFNNYIKVLVKDVIDITSAEEDSIGNDAVLIQDIWVSSNYYLNVFFRMNQPARYKHMVNLVYNLEEEHADDGYAYLEYRYNDMDDNAGRQVVGLVSFDLTGYTPEQGYKGIKLKVNDRGTEKYLTFNFSAPGEGNEEVITDPGEIE